MVGENKFKKIEEKWRGFWERHPEMFAGVDNESKRKKFYVLVEFPYPSGAGLHIGHARSWTAMDIYSRKKRMEGYNVMYPMGWDAFGLPAENYALKMGVHPSKIVPENIAKFKEQCKTLALSFDWDREIDTTDPKYYRWTQWIFLQLFKKGLAKWLETQVNWCPVCKTTLANEEVDADGTHERCGKPTEKKTQRQWVIGITQYADRLIDDLKLVDYSPNIAAQQVKWIDRKEWIDISYDIENTKERVTVATTRPDTNFGATFIVLAPEHGLVSKLMSGEIETSEDLVRIKEYVARARNKSELERQQEVLGRDKSGVFTGLYALNQLNGKRMPIWITDFVLSTVGTGAVVGVPGHDVRDFEFAKQFGIEIIRVVIGKNGDKGEIIQKEQVQEEEGIMTNSGFLDGMDIHEATKKIMDHIEEKGWGKRSIRYHLRDWIFSRQHYWGEPIPIIHCRKCGEVPVPEDQLPVELPYVEKYEPSGTGESPLANITEWVNTACPKCGGEARRETDTMPNWAGSNWYYLAYCFADMLANSNNQKTISKQVPSSKFQIPTIFEQNRDKLKYWMPVDVYQGGFEHTTLHLLYSRFIYKFLYDIGVVPGPEPYLKRRSHGIVLGADGNKMSKSFGNVINPDEVIEKIGVDALRIYEMFMGPFDQMVSWSDESASGCYRFLIRAESLFQTKIGDEGNPELLGRLNRTVFKVGQDVENFKFNTAVSTMMEFINSWTQSQKPLSRDGAVMFLRVLAIFAPYLAEEIWSGLRKENDPVSIHLTLWPEVEEKYLVEETATMPVMVDGRVRDQLTITSYELQNQEEIIKMAKEREKIKKWLLGNEIIKEIYVPGKLVNLVVKIRG